MEAAALAHSVYILAAAPRRRRPPSLANNWTARTLPSLSSHPQPSPATSAGCRCSTNRDVDIGKTTAPDDNSIAAFQPEEDVRNGGDTGPHNQPGLVLGVGAAGAWDSGDVGSPVVKRFVSDDEERWYMWYHGALSKAVAAGESGDSIGLAVSRNGLHWERGQGPVQSGAHVGLVLGRSDDWWAFDTLGVRPAEVLVMSSSKVRASTAVYWLYYTGFSSERVDQPVPSSNPENIIDRGGCAAFKSLSGLAISHDGRHWARIEGDHHSGALLDVGGEEEWDSVFIAGPKVISHRTGDLRMYYHSFDIQSGRYGIGIARSRDGMRWMKLGKILDGGPAGSFNEAGVLNGHVVRKDDGGYLMAYEGVAADGRRSIGVAESEDGLKDWRYGDGAVLLPSSAEDGWDNMALGSPCLVRMDGDEQWRLYYRGLGKRGSAGIGVAVCKSGQLQNLQRWTGFCV